VLTCRNRANGAELSKANTSEPESPILPERVESSVVVERLENQPVRQLLVTGGSWHAAMSASGMRLRRSMLEGFKRLATIEERRALARGLISIGWGLVEGIPGKRPVAKPVDAWTFGDLRDAIVWGVSNRGGSPPPAFESILEGLARGDLSGLGPAADVLEESGFDNPSLLWWLRNPFQPDYRGEAHDGDAETAG
jgi:hypothetical protein